MSPGDDLRGDSLGFSPAGGEVPPNRGDPGTSHGPEAGSRRARPPRAAAAGGAAGAPPGGRSPLLKTLADAEAAAHSAVTHLVSFKHALQDEFAHSRKSAADRQRIARQRALLLEKLEEFRRVNKSVRQALRRLRDAEDARIDADEQIGTLRTRIAQAEADSEHLRGDLSEAERRIEELMDLRREEQESMKSAVNISKSIEATRAHLQRQLGIKEAENERLNAQLQALERTLVDQKMEIDDLRGSIASVSERAEQDADLLRKATRAQKRRAERFEAAVEKCYATLKEKDAQLADGRLERDAHRRQKDQMTDENARLAAHIELLKSRVADLTAKLRREKDEVAAASEAVMQRVEKLTRDNKDLNVNNAALKASVARLEKQIADCEAALIEEKMVSEERKHRAERNQYQAAELDAEVDRLRAKYANLARETERLRGGKDAKVEKVRQELQGRVDELAHFPELLSAAEQSLLECQESLRCSERKSSEKSESVRQLQVKMESQAKLLKSSVEMRESTQEANAKLQERVNSHQKQLDQLHQENQELVRRLVTQEEALDYSNRQLDQRSTECQALSRQLEAALSDVRQQVKKVKDQAVSREEALQTKIQELEAERTRRDNELRLLRQSKLTAEKQFKVRLKDLQLSLEQSESHKQSIQNYIDFLKNSYKMMFDEGPPPSGLGPSYFLK